MYSGYNNDDWPPEFTYEQMRAMPVEACATQAYGDDDEDEEDLQTLPSQTMSQTQLETWQKDDKQQALDIEDYRRKHGMYPWERSIEELTALPGQDLLDLRPEEPMGGFTNK